MQTLQVSLDARSYPIHIGRPEANEFGHMLRDAVPKCSKIIIVHDESVASFAARNAMVIAPDSRSIHLVSVASGETSKSVEQLDRLWKTMLSLKADRQSVLVAIGGGVIGDLVGFVASTWNRGVRFVQVPTTLLAMVDSSVGGKTGINLPEAKNVIGAFWQPSLVWIDTASLDSLPDREYRSGLAEVVKYGVILDEAFFRSLEDRASDILGRDDCAVTEIVKRSCELKAQVVAADERETTGLRAILNYGHTFGHAIETLAEYGTYLHGEAISIGMTMAGTLALSLGRWTASDLERQTELLARFGLPTRIAPAIASRFSHAAMMDAMLLDKKTSHGRLHLILPSRIGHVETVVDAPLELIEDAIDACLG